MFRKTLMALAVASLATGTWAAVSPDEAKQLGTTLTPVGADKNANADGTIPAWTGGLTAPPANFKAGGLRVDPYPDDKPRLVITGKNMAEHASKLTAGTQELLKRYPMMRVDVYPTRRPVVYSKRITDNVMKNATFAKTDESGNGIQGLYAGFPFPIPKNGNEAMWNHLFRYVGVATDCKYESWNVDSAGVPTLATTGQIRNEYPVFDPRKTEAAKGVDLYFRTKLFYLAPARRNGEALIAQDTINPLEQPRRAWQYLPGQRRVKLAPDISYDTPNPGTAGASTYDDAWVFNGAQDRYDWKLLGKKEMYVPYNTYKLNNVQNIADLIKPSFLNPDLVRWELHRVWVVEATLKPGKRHVYTKRVFYLDEDSWVALTSDQYDARGQLYRSTSLNTMFAYDVQTMEAGNQNNYDYSSGAYSLSGTCGLYGGIKYAEPLPESQWSPESLAGSGVR